MLFRCFAFFLATQGFLTEIPDRLRDKFLTTNETTGVFEQIKKLPTGDTFKMKGTYKITPGKSFEWQTLEPFETLFQATKEKYLYSNEDECVTKPLSELKGFANFKDIDEGDFSSFFKAFDALYKEDGEIFHLLAKPKDDRLKRVLTRIEADGYITNWIFRATFPSKTTIEIHLNDDVKKLAN